MFWVEAWKLNKKPKSLSRIEAYGKSKNLSPKILVSEK